MRSLLSAAPVIAAVLFGFLASVTTIGVLFIGAGAALMLVTLLLYIPFSKLSRVKY